ncbi:hypothetical protein D3C86_1325130 [compost metagenome]
MISKSRSSTRLKSTSVSLSLFKVCFLRTLYLEIPEASSNRLRREFSLLLIISSIILNSMIEYESAPTPVSRKRSVISFKRHFTSFNRYSLSPFLNNLRVTVTVVNAVGSTFLLLSNVSDTSAKFAALRFFVPLKMIFSIFSERSIRVLCSPKTQRIASTTFDFPQPLGPTIAVTPSLKLMVILSPKLLNPFISSLVNCIYTTIFLH